MSERPTPETDALILSKAGFGPTDWEWRVHARRLENERDEAREAAAKWEAIALREASINGERICGKEAAK